MRSCKTWPLGYFIMKTRLHMNKIFCMALSFLPINLILAFQCHRAALMLVNTYSANGLVANKLLSKEQSQWNMYQNTKRLYSRQWITKCRLQYGSYFAPSMCYILNSRLTMCCWNTDVYFITFVAVQSCVLLWTCNMVGSHIGIARGNTCDMAHHTYTAGGRTKHILW